MAIAWDSSGAVLASAIPDFLSAVETGRALDAEGHRYSAAALRSLQRTLPQVEATLGGVALERVAHADAATLEALAWQVVDRADLPPTRVAPTVEALRRLAASAAPRPPASPPTDPVEHSPAGTPTETMLALGARVGVWIERAVVVAFVLTAIGLALALA